MARKAPASLYIAAVFGTIGFGLALSAHGKRLNALESHTCPCEAVSEEPAPPKGSLADLVRKLQEGGKKGVVR